MGSPPPTCDAHGAQKTANNIGVASVDLTGHAASPYECSGYWLPTESEWEYAARAGEGNAYKDDNALPKIVVFGPVSRQVFVPSEGTHPVASLKPNQRCLYDVLGNTYEYVGELYETYVSSTPENPAVDPWVYSALAASQFKDPDTMTVTRGCGFATTAEYCHLGGRHKKPTSAATFSTGFRLVRTLSADGVILPQEKIVNCQDGEVIH